MTKCIAIKQFKNLLNKKFNTVTFDQDIEDDSKLLSVSQAGMLLKRAVETSGSNTRVTVTNGVNKLISFDKAINLINKV